jgi:four helix bundle protein
MKDFTELKVWQDSKELTVAIYRLTETFPRKEMFGLSDQLRRAANSICANIAEGFDRFHTKDKIRFYYHSRGSISECKSHLMIACELRYLTQEQAAELIEQFNSVSRLLNNMIASLNRCSALRNSN